MDNQSLLDDIELKSIDTSSTNADVPLRIKRDRHVPIDVRFSSENESGGFEDDMERGLIGTKRAAFNRLSTRSFQDPGILMTFSQKSHPLSDRYRYHVFVIYHRSDRKWVAALVKRLESPPLEYKCCIDTRNYIAAHSEVQNIVCALMLSERVVLVLSRDFMKNLWPMLENLLLNVTHPTYQINSKVIAIRLEDITNESLLPEVLRSVNILYAFDEQFWQLLLMSLRRDSTAVYGSSCTLWSLISQTTPLVNGQILYLIKVRIEGFFRPHYSILIEPSPQSGPLQETAISELITDDMLENILDSLHLVDSNLTWLDSGWPHIFILLFGILWLTGFLSVIFKLPDSKSYTLPVRLCVFIFPAAFLLSLIVYRWKSMEWNKEEKSQRIFHSTMSLNAKLFKMNKTIITTSQRNRKMNMFIIYVVYYAMFQCSETVRHIMNTVKKSELTKMKLLVSFVLMHQKSTNELEPFSLPDQMCLTIANSYLSNLLSYQLAPCLRQRHTRKYQCLCQFIEDLISAYLPIIRYPNNFSAKHVATVLHRYFHSSFQIDTNFLTDIGILAPISPPEISTISA